MLSIPQKTQNSEQFSSFSLTFPFTVIVGNMIDRYEDRQVTTEEGIQMAKNLGAIAFFETRFFSLLFPLFPTFSLFFFSISFFERKTNNKSAKTNSGVQECFMEILSYTRAAMKNSLLHKKEKKYGKCNIQ
jgi:GTPase SAR1 family protein